MVENAITHKVTHEIIFMAWVLFFALKYRQANVRYIVGLKTIQENA
jgi:hypothetical protein